MLNRQQELNTQFHQLLDAFVLAFSLFAAHALRFYGTGWLNFPYPIDPFENYQWLLIVLMPFGPIILDLQGFYQSPFNKTLGKSFVQIARTLIYLSILVSGCAARSSRWKRTRGSRRCGIGCAGRAWMNCRNSLMC